MPGQLVEWLADDHRRVAAYTRLLNLGAVGRPACGCVSSARIATTDKPQ